MYLAIYLVYDEKILHKDYDATIKSMIQIVCNSMFFSDYIIFINF